MANITLENSTVPPAPSPGHVRLFVDVNGHVIQQDSNGTEIDLTEAAENSGVISVNGQTGVVVIDGTDIGLGNVDNTSDLNKPISIATQTALDLKIGDAPIDGTPYVRQDAGWVPDVAGGAVDSVNGQTGVVVLDADDIDDSTTVNKFTNAGDISKLAGIEADAEVNTVDSVNGQTGVVVLDADDIGLGNVDNTSDLNKPISIATQTALDLKIGDAPIDGTPYVRQDAGWVPDSVAPSVPTTISNLAASTGAILQSNLTWTAPTSPTPITSYNCQVKLTAGATWSDFVGINVAAVSQIVYALTAVSHDFRIAAVNAAGSAAWSNIATATPINLTGTIAGLFDERGLSGTGAGIRWVNYGTGINWSTTGTFGGTPSNLTQATTKGKIHPRSAGNAGMSTSSPTDVAQQYYHFCSIAPTTLTATKKLIVRDDVGGISDSSVSNTLVDIYAGTNLSVNTVLPTGGTGTIYVARYNNATSSLRVIVNNGVTDITNTGTVGAAAFGLNAFFWNTILEAGRDFVGDIHEFRVVTGAMTTDEIQAVVGALQQKWWSGYPYLSSPIAPPLTTTVGSSIQTTSIVSAVSNAGATTGSINAVGVYLSEPATVSGITVDVSGTGTGLFRIGIYKRIGTGNTYALLAQGSHSFTTENQVQVSIDFTAPVTLTKGLHHIGFLNPQTGGGNPIFYYAPITNSVTRHAFTSQENNQSTLPAVITIQTQLSNMYWAGVY